MKKTVVLSTKDQGLIKKIAERYHGLTATPVGITLMNLTACHLNGNPLKLAELLGTDDFSLRYDVGGINENIDPKTYTLSWFPPRFGVHFK